MDSKESVITKIENGRAEFAYECVKNVVNKKDKKVQGDYRSYVRKIPSMILSNGVGQTLAFIKSKSKNNEAYNVIYEQINNYFKDKDIPIIPMPENKKDMLDWIVSCDSKTHYRYITNELLALFNWLRRFAEGMMEGEEE